MTATDRVTGGENGPYESFQLALCGTIPVLTRTKEPFRLLVLPADDK